MRRLAVLLALALALAACAESKQIGDPGVLEGIKEQKESPSPSPTPTVRPTRTVTPSPTRTAAPKPRAGTFTLVIRETTRGYEPQAFQVFQGAKVTFRNMDTDCPQKSSDPQCRHSWTADDGTWDSGPIPAGGTFVYVAGKVGTFNFHDELVPYLNGTMRVIPLQ